MRPKAYQKGQPRADALPAPKTAAPWVEASASALGVDLRTIKGTGPGGVITNDDVLATFAPTLVALSAARRSLPSGAQPGRLPVTSARAVAQPSAWSNGVTVKVDPWSENPLVEDARQAMAHHVHAAENEAPVPQLFSSGPLPVFMASGADPQLLLKLPWDLRHAAAAADSAALFRMLEGYSGPDGAERLAVDAMEDRALTQNEGNADYRHRVNRWLSGFDAPRSAGERATPARAVANVLDYDALFPDEAIATAREAAAEEERAATAKFKAEQQAREQQRALAIKPGRKI